MLVKSSELVFREVRAVQIMGYIAKIDQNINTAKPTMNVNLFLSGFSRRYSGPMVVSLLRPNKSELNDNQRNTYQKYIECDRRGVSSLEGSNIPIEICGDDV